MKIVNSKNIKLLFLPIFLIGLFFANFAMAQEMPKRTPECDKLYQWFTIKLDKGDTNAIEGLPTICSAQSAFAWVIQLLLLFAGSVTVIFIIIGGFRYLTSAGSEEAAEKAKQTLVTSIIGLVVIVLAATIVRIVVTTLGTGSSSSNNSARPAGQQQPSNSRVPNGQNADPSADPGDFGG